MLVIRKQNFESQPCYCCTGMKANQNDPQYAVVYQLYHKLPDSTKHIPCQVVVPRCKHCADKMKPVRTFAFAGVGIATIGTFMCNFGENGGFWWPLIAAIFVGGVSFFVLSYILNFAFSIVYNQMESEYDIIAVLKNYYGWQTDEPKQGESDGSFTDNKINKMLTDLVENYGCEYGNID